MQPCKRYVQTMRLKSRRPMTCSTCDVHEYATQQLELSFAHDVSSLNFATNAKGHRRVRKVRYKTVLSSSLKLANGYLSGTNIDRVRVYPDKRKS
mmetsp:Transcript_6028/g.13428  ORF Transcript_6028/g.13428 Transcript_6028/m.13428 type:complete len:95 (+) Transcript_6028:2088-2372(+)